MHDRSFRSRAVRAASRAEGLHSSDRDHRPPTALRVTDDGYEARTGHSTTTMRWSLFGRITTGPEFWLFFVNRQFTGFLPRRAFGTGQQAESDGFLASRQNTKVA
ncbi:YcxB family protein [Planomonospora alba]